MQVHLDLIGVTPTLAPIIEIDTANAISPDISHEVLERASWIRIRVIWWLIVSSRLFFCFPGE
ncbi:hypothetical protein, partial [Brytella acorum]